MPDRFTELLDRAQRGRLTPDESDELARMLNEPILAPAEHAGLSQNTRLNRVICRHELRPFLGSPNAECHLRSI